MTEELKQKARYFVKEYLRDNLILDEDALVQFATEATKKLQEQIEKMKAELHHRLVSPSHDDSDCLDKIVGLDRLWQFGQEF